MFDPHQSIVKPPTTFGFTHSSLFSSSSATPSFFLSLTLSPVFVFIFSIDPLVRSTICLISAVKVSNIFASASPFSPSLSPSSSNQKPQNLIHSTQTINHFHPSFLHIFQLSSNPSESS
ncbi:hypothetical protein K435DRAFT_872308 [Dendrothele bispora CBS 962.96]|uniref:Uncharacterized protein n=1 Tax=Dendrothele bispora (strain CBS 962.96) TaxID=1314807 RepID=A0A4S8L1X0_DENBC|nr:hypothetical protein K435DRAFT_872308 [Dendrothele bispora CBS 962.96]